MKVGDSVKVLDGDRWREGRILEVYGSSCTVGVGESHQLNYFEKTYHQNRIRRFERVANSDDAMRTMYLSCKESLQEALHSALLELLPGESGVVDDEGVSLYHGSVTIQPCIFEVKCIGVDREVVGWGVSGWSSYPDTRHEPGGVDETSLGNYRHYGDAIQAVFDRKVHDYFQRESESAMAAEVVP